METYAGHVTPFETYQEYLALKLHFTTDYDFVKYNGKVAVEESALDKRPDKAQFIRIAKRYKKISVVREVFVSNFISGKLNEWVGYYATEEANERYIKWKKGLQSFTYIFEQECKKIKAYMDKDQVHYAKMFVPDEGQHPLLLRYYIANEISLETLIVIMEIFKIKKSWEETIKDPVIYPDIVNLIDRYRPFMKYDKDKAKDVLKKIFVDSQ